MRKTVIIGAGLSGLLAAIKFKDATIYERNAPVEQHKALLRFRDQSVSTLTGIPFKPVRVYKEVFWHGVMCTSVTNVIANSYSLKVSGGLRGRSIRNLDPVDRFIAPRDFYTQLAEKVWKRVRWNWTINAAEIASMSSECNIISTAPMNVLLDLLGMEHNLCFERESIRVSRFRLPEDSDVYQTIYFPQPDLAVYRASITGNVLIVESMARKATDEVWTSEEYADELATVKHAFGISSVATSDEEVVHQRYGKIVDLDRDRREAILHELTEKHNIYSIGRFATWRNILLDDVVSDLDVVERIMAASSYGRSLLKARETV